MPESWSEIAERLRAEQGKSQDTLAYEARSHGGPAGLNSAWFSKVKKGQRPATPEFLRGIAGALGIPPESFVEYRLALARRQLDEREVGLEQAAENLVAIFGDGDLGIDAAGQQAVADLARQAREPRAGRRGRG